MPHKPLTQWMEGPLVERMNDPASVLKRFLSAPLFGDEWSRTPSSTWGRVLELRSGRVEASPAPPPPALSSRADV